jgi:DNA-binding winged helix-turn-helix (wHTH) protein/tetratricopeptide (TPR) repeat protein
MDQNLNGGKVAAFGSFRFDLSTLELRKCDIKVRLEEKPALVLRHLVESAGMVVTRDQLQKLLWPDGVHVDFNHGLDKSVHRLRAVLGDERGQPGYIETLSRRGYRFIAQVEILCERSHASAVPVLPAPTLTPSLSIQAIPVSPRFSIVERSHDRSGESWWSRYSLAAVFAVASVLMILLFANSVSRSRNAFASGPRKTVAVVGFRNLSGRNEDAWLSTALTEWLTTDLATGGQLRPASSEEVAQIRAGIPLELPGGLSHDSLQHIRQNVGADLVVWGSYARSNGQNPGQLRVDIRVQDAQSGELLDAVSVNGGDSAILDLTSQIGQRLRTDFGLSPLSKNALRQIEDALPKNSDAARLYSQGIEQLRRFETRKAQTSLMEASSSEPRNALIHSALSTTWSNLGHSRDALSEAQKAFDLSSDLPLETRLLIEGQLKETSYDWAGAIDVYRTLFQHYPDNVDYGLRLATVEAVAGRGAAAQDTVELLRKNSSFGSKDPRIDLAESAVAASYSDFKRELKAAKAAVDRSRVLGASLLTARAEVEEGEALRALGELTNAAPLWEDARGKFESAGDQSAVAQVFVDEGRLLWQQGKYEDSRKTYEAGIAISKSIGDDRNLGRALAGLSQIEMYREGPAEGRRICKAALDIFRRIGNKQEEAYTLSLLADTVASHHEESKRLYEESLALSREVNDRSRTAGRLMDLGIIATVQGDLTTANQELEESLKIYREIGERNREALQLAELAIVRKWQGRSDEAEQLANESISTLTAIGEINTRGQVRGSLAQIQLEAGKLGEAEHSIRLAIDDHRQTKDLGSIGISTAVLAEILAAEGRYVESRTALQDYQGIVRHNPPPGEHLPVMSLTRARLYAASGDYVSALREAHNACELAMKMDQGSMLMKTRLVQAELELSSGNTEAAQRDLRELVRDADAKGFGLIVQKARKLRKS